MSIVIGHHSSSVPSVNPTLWLRADKGVIADNSNIVTTWQDQSGNAYDVTTTTPSYKPTLVNNVLNGKPSIRYIAGKRLFFTNTITIKTLFVVANFNSSTTFPFYNGILGSTGVRVLDANRYLTTFYSAFWDNLYINSIETTEFAPLLDYKLITGIRLSNLVLNDLYVGYGVVNDDSWNGDILEIIIYNTVLDNLQIKSVEQYLKRKYAI